MRTLRDSAASADIEGMSNRRSRSVVPAVAGFVSVAAVLAWVVYQGVIYDLTGGSSVGLVVTIGLAMAAFFAVVVAAAMLVVAARSATPRASSVSYERRRRS